MAPRGVWSQIATLRQLVRWQDMWRFFLLGSVAVATLVSTPAYACSLSDDDASAFGILQGSVDVAPRNGIAWLNDGVEYRIVDGAGAIYRFVPAPDVRLPGRDGTYARLPAELPAGAITVESRSAPGEPWRSSPLSVDEAADETIPEAARTPSATVMLFEDPNEGAGCSCPDLDTLVLSSEGEDDRTPRASSALLVFAAATAEEARTAPPSALLWRSEATSRSFLGMGGERVRSETYPLAAAALCFSTAIVDLAGNVGPRSDAICIDTTNPADERVDVQEGSGCAIASRGPGVGALVLTALCALALRRSRGRSAPGTCAADRRR